jgi:hypothetical protein
MRSLAESFSLRAFREACAQNRIFFRETPTEKMNDPKMRGRFDKKTHLWYKMERIGVAEWHRMTHSISWVGWSHSILCHNHKTQFRSSSFSQNETSKITETKGVQESSLPVSKRTRLAGFPKNLDTHSAASTPSDKAVPDHSQHVTFSTFSKGYCGTRGIYSGSMPGAFMPSNTKASVKTKKKKKSLMFPSQRLWFGHLFWKEFPKNLFFIFYFWA